MEEDAFLWRFTVEAGGERETTALLGERGEGREEGGVGRQREAEVKLSVWR